MNEVVINYQNFVRKFWTSCHLFNNRDDLVHKTHHRN